jgi:hypothetical protein
MSSNDKDSMFLQKLFEACETKQLTQVLQQQQEQQPPTSSWMDDLVTQLLQPKTCDQALQLVVALVQLDPTKYLLPLSKSVVAHVVSPKESSSSSSNVHISDPLLQVWIYQMVLTDQVSVHTNLFQALLWEMVQQQQSPLLFLEPAMTQLVQVWKLSSQENNSSNKHQASIVSIRCATMVIQCIDKLGDVAFHICQQQGATDLILQMLQDHSDPLLQLSVLDLFPQHLQQQPQNLLQVASKEWLGKDLTQPCIELLQDPLVSGSAMQFLGLVCALDDLEDSSVVAQHALLEHIREMGITTSESDRLQVVHALSQVATSKNGLQLILEDVSLRCAWWGDLSRLSSPKLQAAILSSVHMLMQQESAKPQVQQQYGMKTYAFLGQDNNSSNRHNTTTQWMFSKYVKSPMPELRIASYSVLEQVAGLSGGTNLLSICSECMEWMLQGQRESSSDARVAKFELLRAFYQHAQGFLAEDMIVKLKKLVDLGPHGQIPQRWDVAVE